MAPLGPCDLSDALKVRQTIGRARMRGLSRSRPLLSPLKRRVCRPVRSGGGSYEALVLLIPALAAILISFLFAACRFTRTTCHVTVLRMRMRLLLRPPSEQCQVTTRCSSRCVGGAAQFPGATADSWSARC